MGAPPKLWPFPRRRRPCTRATGGLARGGRAPTWRTPGEVETVGPGRACRSVDQWSGVCRCGSREASEFDLRVQGKISNLTACLPMFKCTLRRPFPRMGSTRRVLGISATGRLSSGERSCLVWFCVSDRDGWSRSTLPTNMEVDNPLFVEEH